MGFNFKTERLSLGGSIPLCVSMFAEHLTTEFTELTELWFYVLHTRIPSVFFCVLCGDDDIPRLQNPAELRNAAVFHFSPSSKLLVVSIPLPSRLNVNCEAGFM